MNKRIAVLSGVAVTAVAALSVLGLQEGKDASVGLTVKQAAEMLATDTQVVRRYIRRGVLRAERQSNGRYLVSEEDVRRIKRDATYWMG